jgi:hypothetical protein
VSLARLAGVSFAWRVALALGVEPSDEVLAQLVVAARAAINAGVGLALNDWRDMTRAEQGAWTVAARGVVEAEDADRPVGRILRSLRTGKLPADVDHG